MESVVGEGIIVFIGNQSVWGFVGQVKYVGCYFQGDGKLLEDYELMNDMI